MGRAGPPPARLAESWRFGSPAFVSQIADHWSTNQSTSACLSVSGGETNSTDGAATELRSCAATSDQRWSIEWR